MGRKELAISMQSNWDVESWGLFLGSSWLFLFYLRKEEKMLIKRWQLSQGSGTSKCYHGTVIVAENSWHFVSCILMFQMGSCNVWRKYQAFKKLVKNLWPFFHSLVNLYYFHPLQLTRWCLALILYEPHCWTVILKSNIHKKNYLNVKFWLRYRLIRNVLYITWKKLCISKRRCCRKLCAFYHEMQMFQYRVLR